MIINREKITKGFCEEKLSQGHELVFFPRSGGEARVIHLYLSTMGYPWIGGGASFSEERGRHCVNNGMLLFKGEICLKADEGSIKNGILCSVEQFAENYMPLPSLEEFNQLAAKVKEVESHVRPSVLNKTSIGPKV